MIKQLLNQNWFLQKNNCETSFPTAIPTSVIDTVLADNNQIPDPYWKDNEDVVRDVINDDYTYTCTFSPLPEFLEEDACILRFDGIDTISDVYLNNVLLGHTANMHRTWEFDVTTLLLQGENQLKIVLHSPLKAAKRSLCTVSYPWFGRCLGRFQPYSKSPLHVWMGLGRSSPRCRYFP